MIPSAPKRRAHGTLEGDPKSLGRHVASAIDIDPKGKATGKVCKTVTRKRWLAGFWPATTRLFSRGAKGVRPHINVQVAGVKNA
ncbi:hypothetical protein FGADI_9137 [Fusarium gaditjirri]|uniref:Uncharacterized protein n=1 Tax=Fusarium gaditjirri TaxID=282569 RepID=A0A8H4T0S4_9HYPO|nr:hypothetical protein FGADI_9137 [Fusarium gaditjirri]